MSIRTPRTVFETWSLWLTQKLEKDMTFRGVYLDFDSLRVKGKKIFFIKWGLHNICANTKDNIFIASLESQIRVSIADLNVQQFLK